MGRPEWTEEQKRKFAYLMKEKKLKYMEDEKRNPKNYLRGYDEGNFNNHEVVIVSLRNRLGLKKYIVDNQSQLAMRTKYYYINGVVNDYLENGLQGRLVIPEDYEEINLNEEKVFVNKNLL